ncbi:hypothetical protein SLAV_29605 [Streptomyces lavendulae subsp. lavendulae]|uniref:Uncharacterized protein n=1 Tax=Streptomyces lavendulae subsp. lavendulae TaxID=58340 RepID=A0A2K8PLU6_STRLA|nr:hypothetical protein [Streptomyces lavendulae]ATZ27706.1 hypothetical protein SLAV_29605 [Streptomyces lavendulae subsp. lavendulae]QUQ57533.1 hypothetical protein SLLC_27755 [Streptomyces lavendulae subsp. lavendulae]
MSTGTVTGETAEPVFARPGDWTDFDRTVRLPRGHGHGACDDARIEVRLCHPDGRIRQAALGAPDAPLPLIAVRATDWVPAVRTRARQVLEQVLAADPPGTLRALTPLVLRLGRREQGAWALERFEAALHAEPSVLADLCGDADPPTRRFAARLSLRRAEPGPRDAARRAAAETDPATARLWTDAALAAMAARGPDDEAVDALLGARIPMVRAAGVTCLHRAGRSSEADRYLADRSGLVRACARWLVRQDGGDPYARCRALLADPERVGRYAVAGFAECAGRGDAPLLRSLVDHPLDVIRAEALAGLRLLDNTDPALLRPLLDDPSPAVARQASLGLCGSAEQLPVGPLLELIAPGRPAHTRRAAYRVLHARGGVAGLRASVELLTDRDPALRRIAGQRIQNTLMSPRGRAGLPLREPEVGALLDRSAGLFSGRVLERIRTMLALPPGGVR